jgi:hypothetical protein
MKRGALLATVVLAMSVFACERKQDENKPSETTTTSGTVQDEKKVNDEYQGSPGVTGGAATSNPSEMTTGTEQNATTPGGTAGPESTMTYDQPGGAPEAKDAGVMSDFEKKDGGHVQKGMMRDK